MRYNDPTTDHLTGSPRSAELLAAVEDVRRALSSPRRWARSSRAFVRHFLAEDERPEAWVSARDAAQLYAALCYSMGHPHPWPLTSLKNAVGTSHVTSGGLLECLGWSRVSEELDEALPPAGQETKETA